MPVTPRLTVQQLKPYHKPLEGRSEFARLDFNENTTGFPAVYPDGVPAFAISAYPEYDVFINRLADFYEVNADSILLTNGSDEGISVVAQTFVEIQGDYAVVSDPCFSMIPQLLTLAGATLREVKVLPDLSFDLAGIETALQQGAKIAMFATPENPTGAILDRESIKKWCTQYPNTLFVIDEAYGEFADSSMLTNIKKFENLLVLKTFSKAWGMAGLRLGIAFGAPALIEYMQRVKLPYSVNAMAVQTANKLLDRASEVKATAAKAVVDINKLADELIDEGYRVNKGFSNSFLLGAGINAERLSEHCRSRGVLIRNRSNSVFVDDLNGNRPVMWGRLRVSVGTENEHIKFLTALNSFNKNYGILFDLDGTLVDTTFSFDQTVKELVEHYTGHLLPDAELQALRAEGGFNDDWQAAHELIKRRGTVVPLEDVIQRALPLYLSIAKKNEQMMCSWAVLGKLRKRHSLYIITGRTRPEYEPIWAERLDPIFSRIYCLGDIQGKQAKPSPDYLLQAMSDASLTGGCYIGNSVDDMQAARAAGLDAIGITSTQPAEVLKKAGAQITIKSMEQLEEVFML
ncbi:MAG: aminotransferase class I/II-fold pyridoxal phosphate-dependent enzyme [Candidatus Obscuribacterales bacterium]|nr:aminotransferase class I/II-fold pyridoxal phosphate-dependent enzyme [Candidatus Obscuribacterales bacterium]